MPAFSPDPRFYRSLPPAFPDGLPPDLNVDPGMNSPSYFSLDGPVGRGSANDRPDVIKAQTLLGNAGYYDLVGTDGPTGWYGEPLERAMRRYQKDNGLTVDGVMLPGGETVSSLRTLLGPRLDAFHPPGPDEIDEHHDRIARGQQGLLTSAQLGATPIGVKTADGQVYDDRPRNKQVAQVDEAAMLLLGLGAAAAAAGGAIARRVGEQGQPKKPLGDEPAGGNTGARRDANLQGPNFHAQNRAMLDKGVLDAWGGPLERNESDNTRLSSNIVVKECLKVIKADAELVNAGFEHIAGASEMGEGKQEKEEKGFRNRDTKSFGKGSSFPDILFKDATGNMVAINTATESSPGRYIKWERGSFDRLVYNMGKHVAKIIGKKRRDESEDEYSARAEQVCRDAFDEAKARIGRAQEAKDDADGAAPDAAPAANVLQ